MTEITELITQEYSELTDYRVDQSVICAKGFLKYLTPKEPEEDDDWENKEFENFFIPYIFHPHTEEITIEHRVNTFKNDSSSELFIPESKSNIAFSFGRDKTSMDPYDEDSAEEQYLKDRPVSFFIISKPNIGEVELAKTLANHWKCVLITPESVLKEEIASDSRVGKCINFNLVNGRAIGPEVILRLVERRIKSETAKHRGFVVAGFPLIPNKLYKEDPLSSESAIFNVEEIFEEIVVKCPLERPTTASTIKGSKVSIDVDRVPSDEMTVEEEEIVDVPVEIPQKKVDVDLGPDRGEIINNADTYHCLHKVTHQLEFLFKLCKKPFILIYVYCSNMDVVNKIEKYRFNVFTEQEVCLQKEAVDTAFSPNLSTNIPEDDGDDIDLKYLVQLPTYQNASISAQLISFKYKLLKIIDKNVLAHDPQYFIKVDGRHNALKMFGAIRPRIKSLGFQPVLIPERLTDSEEVEDEFNEEPQYSPQEVSLEETFLKHRYTNVVSPMYKWHLSNWGFKCPVALKNGRIVNGLAENAVRFMNKIFFLSDENALIQFCRNPRPFIIPIKPKPVYRIFVIGPKYSGKSAVAKCLAYLFDCILLNPQELEDEFKRKKELAYLEKVRTAAIAEGMMALEDIREKEKETKIKFWLKNTIGLLKTEYPEFKSKIKLVDGDQEPVSEEQETDDPSGNSIVSNLSERTHSEIVIELQKINLPLSDPEKVQGFFEDCRNLLEYLPEELNAPITPPTVFDAFVTEYVSKAIEEAKLEDNTLHPDEKYDMYRTVIKNIENVGWTYNSGWVVDGFPADVDVLREFPAEELADEIICLEDEPGYAFLLDKFKKKEPEFTSFKKFFRRIRKDSAAERVPIFMGSSFSLFGRSSRKYSNDSNAEEEPKEGENKEDYPAILQDFSNQWAEAKRYLQSVCLDPPIIVSVTNKPIHTLMMECILKIENKYRRTAKIVTDEDKAQEARDFGGKLDIEEEEEVGEEEPPADDISLENKRYGDSKEYCPVAYFKHSVLWKGKERFSVEFKEKLYYLSSEEALHSFLEDPRAYLTENPINFIPPPRICIVGPIGSGKTTLAKALAKNFGLFYLNFEELLLDSLDLEITHKIDELIHQKNLANMNENAQVHMDDINMLRSYLQQNGQLSETLLHVLNAFWFEDPFKSVGFVLDNFPRKQSDIDYLTKYYMIPDVVIELHANLDQIHSRIFNFKMEAWESEMNKKKEAKEEENGLKLGIWEMEKDKRMTELLDAIKEERRQEFFTNQPPVPPYSSPVDSSTALAHIPEETEEEELHMFVYDPVQEQEDLEDIRLKLDLEFPRPETSEMWESYAEATDRIEGMITDTFERDINLLNDLRIHLKYENIDCVPFATKTSAEGVFLQVCKLADKLKFRNHSLFERVYSITIDVAEKLLEQGCYFLSKFGRTCPVQVYVKENPVQMFLSSEHKMGIHPMIHRKYIYFICGSTHADSFKVNPIKYVQNSDYELPLFPLKVAILGPPKSGKSILAEKFQKEFGVKVITRGQAARYVMKHFPFCELAQNMRTVLEKGWSLTYEMIAGAVEAMTLDGKSISQGYVLDGFPDSVEELKHLKELGIIPYVFLDVAVEEDKIRECTVNEIGKKMMPPLSYEFVSMRCKHWAKEFEKLKDWVSGEYQNMYTIPKPDSKWAVWAAAKHITFHNLNNMLTYYINKDIDMVFQLKSLLITPFEFSEKESSFKNFCPGCLYHNNYLVSGGEPPEKHGLAQYRDFYYWICSDHMAEFIKKPKRYLPPQNERTLPDDLPFILNDKCDAIYQTGICIVTFWENQPRNIIKYGTSQFSVMYKNMCYLFCSEECLLKFMKEPHIYCDKIVRFRNPRPLELSQLPTLGYLEQYVANLLIRAIINTETNRPVHPYMNVEQSALINIALYLKIYNPKAKKEYVPVFEEFRRLFDERRELVKEMIKFFNTTENPFLCLED